ncbi:MAG TPA: amino acid adenylation domain-containing protein, partial [Thermoanaerobaculia bacterium]|nr:amino acid adenylation domain-containing protein [Thermoanaerobaculia bacterium]
ELDFSAMLPLPFPFSGPSPEAPESDPQRLWVRVEPRLKAALEAMAAARQSTVAAVLLTCWQLLLWRLSGQSDIAVGVICDGRKFEELGSALGLFARAVPVHARWEPHFHLRDMLRRIQQAQGTAFELQEYLVQGDEAGSPRGLGSLDIHFEVLEAPPALRAGKVGFAVREILARIDYCRLKLVCIPEGESLTLRLEHDPRAVPGPIVAQLAARLLALIGSAAAHPDATVGDLTDVDEGQRHWLLREVNDTKIADPTEPVHAQFERWAKLRPDRAALRFEEQELTYGELNRRANRLANRLRALSVGPEVVVPLLAERSIDMVVGLLAVLKAGGAYLPLDPALPAHRLTAILETSQAPVLLAQADLLDRLPPHGSRLVLLDGNSRDLASEPEADLPPLAALENPAYVLFTSGSTGRPKGVVIEHRQLANYLAAVTRRLGLGEGASYALVSTFAADLGNTVLFPALCGGGSLHVISAERATDPEAYAEYASHYGIDCLKIVPTHLSALLQSDHPERVMPRELLVLGGEACSWDLVDRSARLAPACRVLNHYGPTETTVGVTTQQLFPDPWPQRPARPLLGLPLANVRAYALEPGGEPVATGAVGELHLGGACVSRGYLGRPDLTAERFIPDPFGPERGARLYRTGDLVRRTTDGGLEFVGRADDQIKLRGFRIELGEVEATLAGHPQVRAVAVMLREDEPDKKRIVTYVVPVSGALRAQELKEFLQERLPDPMVPSAFVFLDALPLTPNGKLDRRALPAPDSNRSDARASYAPPTTEVEVRLAEIWQEILAIERVGIYENFFALGGDSILAIQVIARARKAKLEFQPWQIFQHQTIADLAAVVGTRPALTAEQGLVSGEVPLVPIQRWFFDRGTREPHHWNQAALLEAQTRLDPALVETGVALLVAHHDALRTRFEPTPAGWRQVVSAEVGTAPVSQVDLADLPEPIRTAEMERAAAALQGSLDISHGPLLCVVHFPLGADGSGRLLLIVHHLIVDGVSWRILLEDLQSVYQSLAAGQQPSLSPKTTSFRHWAERLAAHVAAGKVDGELTDWSALTRARISLLPIDHPGGRDRVGSARTLSVDLPEAETRLLLQEVPAAYNTQINDVLLTALAREFLAWTGGSLLVQMEGHGREPLFEDVDLSRTVGWFTARFPVLLQLPQGAEDRPGECLKTVKEQLRRVPGRGLGFGLLRYLGNPVVQGRLAALPVPQVVFNYLGQFDQVMPEGALLRPARESCGPTRSSTDERDCLIEITCLVLRGRLRMGWTYGSELYDASTIEALAEGFLARLRELISHCLSPTAGGFTPSDFPLASLDEETLTRLSSLISQAE